ncbi:MAG: nuclear transport factor 2 family protein [Clostridiales bacterium]|nr:nuclear transport factor 2 family protein [Clostridiales bacterium]
MDQALETRLGTLEDAVATLKKQLDEKDRRIRDLEDIEAIKRLQCAYGYYLEHWMSEEIIDLFADHPETLATYVEGTYLGLKGVRRYFGKMRYAPPTFLHQVMQISPVITLSDDRTRAKGRWYGYGTVCSAPVDGKIDPMYMAVIYEMEYIRENGVWKILKLEFQMHYAYKTLLPWTAPAAKPAENSEPPRDEMSDMKLSPDIWADYNTQYPSGYIYPMHFVHPVTGKVTTENDYNAKLKLVPSPFKPK